MTENPQFSNKELDIIQAVRAIKYGTVLVVINNTEVVQIESTNKKRFDAAAQRKYEESC